MNTSALKAFAPAVRKQLMEAVSIKLDFALSASTPDYLDTYASQVRALRELATTDRKGLVERVAYSWFNRLAALRYLDARNWHPFHARVLIATSVEDTLPELFAMARTGAVPEELRRYVDVARMESILQGRIPSADPQGEAYRMLVLGACRFYHGLLPDVFERLDDETELLLPDDLLTQQSVAQGFRTEITDEDCEQVEVLGWLYQFYISEKKDQVMARKTAVPAEDIPAVTQLFTPHWIVRYLVENSLGRLWLLNRPESLLKAWMPYYIESAEPETEFLRIARPQDIRLCDPAVGSGHMLTYAFDLLYVIYEEEGYAPSEIPALILRHNLTGIEIDARAAQLAALALTLKAREKSLQFFQQQHFVRPNIVELHDIHFAEGELLGYSEALRLGGLFTPPILQLMHQFEEAKTFGSLIQPCVGEADIGFARGSVQARDLGSNLFLNATHMKVLRVLEQAEALTQRYLIVIANPPYLGRGAMNLRIRYFADVYHSNAKFDLYAMFIDRIRKLTQPVGFFAMITMHSWMFLGSFKLLRADLVSEVTLRVAAHLGAHSFDTIGGEVVQTVAFVYQNSTTSNAIATIFRLVHGRNEREKDLLLIDAISNPNCDVVYRAAPSRFVKLPDKVFGYWLSEQAMKGFEDGTSLATVAKPRQGLATTNNSKFLRLWHEVGQRSISFDCADMDACQKSPARWFPINKGGTFRRWYGNHDYIVDFAKGGKSLCDYIDTTPNVRVKSNGRVINREFYFREGITWSSLGTSFLAMRYSPAGRIFETKGSTCFFESHELLLESLGFTNSTLVNLYIAVLAPTLDFHEGPVGNLPILVTGNPSIQLNVAQCIELARSDWDNFETSWDFQKCVLLPHETGSASLDVRWHDWLRHTTDCIKQMQELETNNNALFIQTYGLQNEVDPAVPEEQITLARADVVATWHFYSLTRLAA